MLAADDACLTNRGILSHDMTTCYYYKDLAFNYNDAIRYCKETFNGTLPILATDGDEQIIVEALRNVPLFFWIGVKARVNQNNHSLVFDNVWIDRVTRNVSKWDVEESEDELESVVCAEASLMLDDESLGWTPRDCDSSLSVTTVCEKKLHLPSSTSTHGILEQITNDTTTRPPTTTQYESGYYSKTTPLIDVYNSTESSLTVVSSDNQLFFQSLIMFNVVYRYTSVLHVLVYCLLVLLMVQVFAAILVITGKCRRNVNDVNDEHTESTGMSVVYVNDKETSDGLTPNTFVIRL